MRAKNSYRNPRISHKYAKYGQLTSQTNGRFLTKFHRSRELPAIEENEFALPRLRNGGEVYRDKYVAVSQYQPAHRIDPEVQQKIDQLEDKITEGVAQVEDYVELDLLYQRIELHGDHERIIGLVKDIFPTSGELFFLQGIEHFFGKKYGLAIRDFDQSQHAGFRCGQMFNTYGAISHRQGDDSAAEMWFNRAVELEPTFEVPYYNLAACHCARGEWEDAEKLMLKSLSLNPCYDRSYVGLAQVIALPNLLPTRRQLLRIALVLEPLNRDTQNLVGQLDLFITTFEKLVNMPAEKLSTIKNDLKELGGRVAPPETSMEELFARREQIYRTFIKYAQSLN